MRFAICEVCPTLWSDFQSRALSLLLIASRSDSKQILNRLVWFCASSRSPQALLRHRRHRLRLTELRRAGPSPSSPGRLTKTSRKVVSLSLFMLSTHFLRTVGVSLSPRAKKSAPRWNEWSLIAFGFNQGPGFACEVVRDFCLICDIVSQCKCCKPGLCMQ